MIHRICLAALAAVLGFGGGALAQTSSGDAGDPAVTEPGGTMGRDGAANVRDGVRDGEAIGAPRGAGMDEGRAERRDPTSRPDRRR